MTATASVPPAPARPWLFTLMCLTGLGAAAILWLVGSSALLRRDDARRHQAIRAELARFDQAQSQAYARDGRYADNLGAASASGLGFIPSPALPIQFTSISSEAWNAVVRDSTLRTAPAACGVFRGPLEASPHRVVTRPGVVACW